MMVFTLAAHELRRLFLSPLAWAVLAVVEFILAWMFLAQIELFMQWQPRLQQLDSPRGLTDIVAVPLLGNAAIVLLLVVPLLTMRLISDERRGRTLSLLISAPLTMTEIVLGKYLGLLAFLGIMLALIAAMPLSLLLGGGLDFGLLAAGLLGLALLLASFAALGLFMSALTSQPTVAAVSTFGALLLLWILDWAGGLAESGESAVLRGLSLLRHYESLLTGAVDSRDLAYFALFILAFLVLSIRRLDSDRLQN